MIEVTIKSVNPFSEYDGIVYSYKVGCVLNSGREIVIVDEKPFNLSQSIREKISLELTTSFLTESYECLNLFEGKVEYLDSKDEYYFVNDDINVLIPKEVIETLNITLNVISVH